MLADQDTGMMFTSNPITGSVRDFDRTVNSLNSAAGHAISRGQLQDRKYSSFLDSKTPNDSPKKGVDFYPVVNLTAVGVGD